MVVAVHVIDLTRGFLVRLSNKPVVVLLRLCHADFSHQFELLILLNKLLGCILLYWHPLSRDTIWRHESNRYLIEANVTAKWKKMEDSTNLGFQNLLGLLFNIIWKRLHHADEEYVRLGKVGLVALPAIFATKENNTMSWITEFQLRGKDCVLVMMMTWNILPEC